MAQFFVTCGPEEIRLTRKFTAVARAVEHPALDGLIMQLEDDGWLARDGDAYVFTWDSFYEACQRDDAVADLVLGHSPDQNVSCRLVSRRSLADSDFEIAVGGWRREQNLLTETTVEGGLLHSSQGDCLLAPQMYRLVRDVIAFAKRPMSLRSGTENRVAWGRIRGLGLAAAVAMDDFLRRTVVLTPEHLEMSLSRVEVDGDQVVELRPSFLGAPENWLEHFDKFKHVEALYNIPTSDGVVQVVVTPQVRTVLEEVKRMPGRRVAGARAQAFLLNPFAALGEHASEVLNEAQIERARSLAGIPHERFFPIIEAEPNGRPFRIGLRIETVLAARPARSEVYWFPDADASRAFVERLGAALQSDAQLVAWQGYDLEIQGESGEHHRLLADAVQQLAQPGLAVTEAEIFDLSAYGTRVEGLGVEKPYHSPYIAKLRNEDGWFPDNVVAAIAWQVADEALPAVLPLSNSARELLKRDIASAESSGGTKVFVPGCPKALKLSEAKELCRVMDQALADIGTGALRPEDQAASAQKKPRMGLVVKPNVAVVDYSEARREALEVDGRRPRLPSTLKPGIALLAHQESGVAWLQWLHEQSQKAMCSGAVLADDMGLGKTLQLLVFVASAIEQNAALDPVLVVAPVSLLENWRKEVDKFFVAGSLPVLTAYGESLSQLRVPQSDIDLQLREQGLARFLRRDWAMGSRLVLTTYETLRDLEFSFARQRWSIMICDEAQRIKNPAAMVTRAAKKQNVGFKIACTGTPVENSLADLWCLFDFIQPGLLGALNEFGRTYRRPIEAGTSEERIQIESLRKLITPQVLRRTKAEVAGDLPKKVEVDTCRNLPLSTKQRNLYGQAIESFRGRRQIDEARPFKNHLSLLHYLRVICTDPRRHGLGSQVPEPLERYKSDAPKLEWLLRQLAAIREADEKAIVFCEFRDIQRLLQHYIEQVFGVCPDIINGETSTSVASASSRQKRLDAFQEKPGFGVIILSPVAAGVGLNIQAANHVIHYTRTWNPAKEDQATDRAYRIGQERSVYVYCPVVSAPDFATFDVKLDQLLAEKRALAADMLNGSADIRPDEFTLVDLSPVDVEIGEGS